MSELLDNSVRARPPTLDARDGPEATAVRVADARDAQGRPRPVVQLIARGEDFEETPQRMMQLRALLEKGAGEDAVAMILERLAPRRRDEAIRRVVFSLLDRQRWRQLLMPVLRRRVVDRDLDPVPSGLFLYGLLKAGRMPRKGLTSPLIWAYGLTWLLDHVDIEAMRPLARRIADQYPRITFLEDVARGLEQVPPRLEGDVFADHWMGEVQFARAADPECRNLMICFTGLFGRMGTPVNMFHRWASRQDAHVVYLRDVRRNFYRHGVACLTRAGHDPVEDMHHFLGTLVHRLGVERIGIYGISMGGIPAVEAALAIGADRVVWAAGTAEREDRSLPWNDPSEAGRRLGIANDLLGRIGASASPPEIACIYGAGFPNDAEMPMVLAAHASVRLYPLEGLSDHNIDFHLVKSGRFDHLVAWAACAPGDLELT